MKSKKGMFLASLAVALAAAITVVAGGDHMAKMKAELNLTDAQVTQIEQKFEQLSPLKEKAKAIKTELQALESAASPNPKAIDAKKAELEGVKKEWKAKSDSIYRTVLTKEQYAKFQVWQAEQEKQYAASKKN